MKRLGLGFLFLLVTLGAVPAGATICTDCAAYEEMALCVGTDTFGWEWCEERVRCRPNGSCTEYCLGHGFCSGQV